MNHNHIVNLLEANRLGSLSPEERSVIEAHITECSKCRQAYEAAQISADLIKARASEIVEPSPFFSKRVMAALAQSPPAKPIEFLKAWKVMGGLVASLAALVVLLLVLTFFNPIHRPQSAAPESASNQSLLEQVLLGEGDVAVNNMTYGHVLETVFNAEDSYGNY